jgi:hypothetical protein
VAWLIVPLLLAGWGCSTSGRSAQPDIERPGEAPEINWDRPSRDGLDIAAGQVANAAAIRQTGSLSFTPIVPKFSTPPTLVQVTPASLAVELREVAFVYRFPLGPDFPTDGRVMVLEKGHMTPSSIVTMEQSIEEMFPGQATLITIGAGITAMLKTSKDGRGEVQMSMPGDVWVDIIGPAIPTATAVKMAQTFG